MTYPSHRLGDVCRLINGRAYKKQEMLKEGPYPLLRVGNFFTNREWYFSDLELNEDKYCDNGDLLYAWSASFGPRIWNGGKVIYHYHIWKLDLNRELVDKKYLYHLLDWDKDRIKEEQGAGTTMVHVTKGSMEARVLPFPPIPEQKRIVAILDKAFADIDRVRELTEHNLQNARELFESYLQQVFSQRGEGWKSTTVGKLVDEGIIDKPLDGNHGEIHPKQADFVEIGVPFIMASDLKNGAVDLAKCNFISKEQADGLRKGFAIDGDVLLTHKATIGEKAILKTDLDYVMLTPQVTYYRVLDENKLSNEYLYWFFHSPEFLRQMRQLAGAGSTRAYIGITKQQKLNFAYPLISEQKKIASKLNNLKGRFSALEPIYLNKLSDLEELKKSILQKAFSGELTKEDKGVAA